MRIYTRTGDGGETSLFNGDRVHKDDARIEAYGTLDELNAVVGGLLDHAALATHVDRLHAIQDHLFRIGGDLPIPRAASGCPHRGRGRHRRPSSGLTAWRSRWSPSNFVLPGGHPALSACHLARTVSRRAGAAPWRSTAS